MVNIQEWAHPEDHDYESGSPHLKYAGLKQQIMNSLEEAVKEQIRLKGTCMVLEVGAGHGDFTETLVGAGADVLVTEMSGPAARRLQEIYKNCDKVAVIYDDSGGWLSESNQLFDLVVCVSVLHHIPDYLGFLHEACDHINANGGLISWQDPLWYPRRSTANLNFERLCYFSWRITRGEFRRGVKTRIRRFRGFLDESNPADMVEYHVVRDGVDEVAIMRLAQLFFDSTSLTEYFSTQSKVFQNLGDSKWARNTFGISASGRKAT
jgi:SAM-dependent methyltransferase